MKQETTDHIETAARNRQLAQALLSHGPNMGLQPPPLEWVAVVAFYSAVHYVNAFLWEQHGISPQAHKEWTGHVKSYSPLTRIRLEYRQLNSHGWNARYAAGYRLSNQQAQALVMTNLAQIEAVVCTALGIR